jgi:hypothetical protein
VAPLLEHPIAPLVSVSLCLCVDVCL